MKNRKLKSFLYMPQASIPWIVYELVFSNLWIKNFKLTSRHWCSQINSTDSVSLSKRMQGVSWLSFRTQVTLKSNCLHTFVSASLKTIHGVGARCQNISKVIKWPTGTRVWLFPVVVFSRRSISSAELEAGGSKAQGGHQRLVVPPLRRVKWAIETQQCLNCSEGI